MLLNWCLVELSLSGYIQKLMETEADPQPNIKQSSGNHAEEVEKRL